MTAFRMIAFAAAAWLTATPVVAAAPASDPAAAVERALALRDYRGATKALNAAVEARLPAKGVRRHDPVLDRLYAQVIAVQGATPFGAMVLQRIIADPATPDAAYHRLLLAANFEGRGDFAAARRGYTELLALPGLTAARRHDARLGLARLLLLDEPAKAVAVLREDSAAGASWETELLLSRALRLTGSDADAAAALERAWAAAPRAPAIDTAVARIAADRMFVAGRSGDRAGLLAALAVDRYARGTPDGLDVLRGTLPVCGQDGIGEQDQVVIELVRQPAPVRPRIGLIWASRTGIARPFVAAALRSATLAAADGHAVALALRCRSIAASDYQVAIDFTEGLLGWLTGIGTYPILSDGSPVDVAQASAQLVDREVRYGASSYHLLPPLFAILAQTPDAGSNQEARTRTAKLTERVLAILIASGAPADLLLQARLATITTSARAQSTAPDAALAEVTALLRQAAQSAAISPDLLYTFVWSAANMPQAPRSLIAGILESALPVLEKAGGKADPRVAATAINLAMLRDGVGDRAGARALIDRYGLPADASSLAMPPVKLVSSNIGTDDYPADLLAGAVQGLVVLDLGIAASGQAERPRATIAVPPFAFDAVTLASVATIRFEPARRNGEAHACRGITQNIRWQIPY